MKDYEKILKDRCFYSTQHHGHEGKFQLNLIHKKDVEKILNLLETESLKIGLFMGLGISLIFDLIIIFV